MLGSNLGFCRACCFSGLITQNDNFNATVKKLKSELQVSERKPGEQLRRQAVLNAQLNRQ